MVGEIGPGRLGSLDALDNRIGVDLVSASGKEGVDVLRGLLDVALDIHGVTRGLGDGETEVEGDNRRDGTETDEQAPAVVDGIVGYRSVKDLVLVSLGDDESDEGGGYCGSLVGEMRYTIFRLTEVPEALHSKDSSHHATTNASGRKLRGDNGGQGVLDNTISASRAGATHVVLTSPPIPTPMIKRHTMRTPMIPTAWPWPERACANVPVMTVHEISVISDFKQTFRLTNHELDTVHLLTTDHVGKPTKEQLAHKCTNGSSDLDAQVLVGVEPGVSLSVDITKHGRGNVDGEDIIGICEETHTRYQARLDVEPTGIAPSEP